MLLVSTILLCLALVLTQLRLTHFKSRIRVFLWILLSSASLFIHGLAAIAALALVSILFNLNPLQSSQHGLIALGITSILFWLMMSCLQWLLWRDRPDALFRSTTSAIAQTVALYHFPMILSMGIDRVSSVLLWLSPILAIAVGCAIGFAIDEAATVLTTSRSN